MTLPHLEAGGGGGGGGGGAEKRQTLAYGSGIFPAWCSMEINYI